MSDFRDFFSKNAESYAKSVSHKKGADLNVLLDNLNLNSSMKAVDLATGTGFTAVALADRVSEVVAYDATPEMLNEARKLSEEMKLDNLQFITGDVMEMPFEDNSFEIATCRRAAHHFTDMNKFLSEVYRILKPGGKLGVSDMIRPEKDSENIFNTLEIVRDSSHIGALTIPTWKEILADAGLEVESMVTSEELYTLEKWLSPITMESKQGIEVQDIINTTDSNVLRNGNVDKEKQTILKQRVILVAKKPL